MSKCYDNPDYDDTSSDIQNTWNQHHKVEQELKKNFYCGDEVDYDEKCLEQCDRCVDAKGVDYGYLPKEIHLEDIFNDEKKEGIKKLIQKQKLIDMMEQDEELGLYEETKCHCGLELDCKDCSQSLQICTCIEDTIDMKQSTKDRILSETSEEIKQRVRETANRLVLKQETLEDAAARLYPTDCTNWSIKIPLDERKAFIEGAKWQQERSYSEEEVLELLEKIQQQVAIDYNDEFLFAKEWFEQFKKN